MDYVQDILNRLLTRYEHQHKKAGSGETIRAVSLDVTHDYPQYKDPYSECEGKISSAIELLTTQGLIRASRNQQGYYSKVTLELSGVPQVFVLLGRVPQSDIRQQQMAAFKETAEYIQGAPHRYCMNQIARLQQGQPLEFGIGVDLEKLQLILLALKKLTQLTKETYIRNFSEAIFHDSKQFKKIQGTVCRILETYAEELADKETILGQYNLLENPAYIYLKGGWKLHYGAAQLDVASVPGGLGIPSESLEQLQKIELVGDRVVSVENLTTFHDAPEEHEAVLYLGGFQNSIRTELLQRLYEGYPHASYYHKGDLDPYGFLILENLKQKTGIPFCPLEMDLHTLQQCYEAGHFRPLEAADRKIMQHPSLSEYEEIFDYMVVHNCKVEQECFEAMTLGI